MIPGGRRWEKDEGREREKEEGRKKRRVRKSWRRERKKRRDSPRIFFLVFIWSALYLSSGFLPVNPIRTQSHPVSLLDGKLYQ